MRLRPSSIGLVRLAVLGVLALLGIASVGVASAYLSGWGDGSGAGSTGTAAEVTVSPATPSAQLYPGGQASVFLTLANPNPGPVRVESLALDTSQGTGGFSVDGAHSACGLATLGFASQTNGGSGWTVPGADSLAVSLDASLSMTTAAANACQGASFTVFLAAGS